MARRISSVFGCALRPGVSRNGRLYTKEMIAAAVAEAQGRLGSGDLSFVDRTGDHMTQRTHHAAEDDSTRIVGRLTSLTVDENGNARFVSDLADTPHGRTIDSLVRPRANDDPDEVDAFLKGVSIRGAWTGNVRTVMYDGQPVETADGLIIDGLDYTARPGVPGAEIDGYMAARSPAMAGARESAGRVPIYESIMEGRVETVEEKGAPALKSGKPAAAPTKAPAGSYADPGYQGDKAKRYPLDTVKHAKSAWSYINQSKNAAAYTAAQLKRIKGRIRAALKKFGVEVSEERWLITRGEVAESVTEYYDDVPASRGAHFNVMLDNGMVCVTVSSCSVDPHDLDALGRAAMEAACAALDKIDPDCDGDMDVPGAPSADTDDDMTETESAVEPIIETQAAPDPVTDETPREEELTVSEPVTPASDNPAATSVTPAAAETSALEVLSAKFDALTTALTGAFAALAPRPAPAEAAPVAPAPVVEAAPAAAVVTETEDQRISRLVAEQVAAQRTSLIQDLVESGQVAGGRKGLVAQVRETSAVSTDANDLTSIPNWPLKDGEPIAPHLLNAQQRQAVEFPMLEQAVMGQRSVWRQQ